MSSAILGARRLAFGIAPAMFMLLVFFAGPLVVNVAQSLKGPAGTEGLGQYARVLGDRYYLLVIAQTLLFGLVVTAICALLGYPFAYLLARTRGRAKTALLFVVVAPLLVNVVVRSFGWMVILGGAGAINTGLRALGLPPADLIYNWTGVTIAMVHVLLPFMVLSIASQIETIDITLEEAASMAGASPAQVFRAVTLPLSLEGLATGCMLSFTLAIGSFVTVMLLGKTATMVLPMLIYQQLTVGADWPFAAAMGTLLLVLVGAVVAAQGFLHGRGRAA